MFGVGRFEQSQVRRTEERMMSHKCGRRVCEDGEVSGGVKECDSGICNNTTKWKEKNPGFKRVY